LRLVKLHVSGIRNLIEQEIAPGPGLNLLTGENAQGKSSLLEAIYLLGTTRSNRASRLTDVITIGHTHARVSGAGERPDEKLAIAIAGRERTYMRAGKAIARSEYIGTMDVVALSTDLVLRFRKQSGERRRFLDRMAIATYPAHLDDLRALRRASSHRAFLLAAGRGGAERKAWDERTAALAVPVARRRHEMAGALGAKLREASRAVFPEGRDVEVALVGRPVYRPEDEAGYARDLAALLQAQPQGAGRNPAPGGPARDDLAIRIDGRDALRYASSGQVRALLTAAALAEMNRLREIKGRFPILLLDDVDSDLDEGRYASLLSALGEGPQVFAATSKARLAFGAFPSWDAAGARFTVREGAVGRP
jgi:DNA replication and repair protein RecF